MAPLGSYPRVDLALVSILLLLVGGGFGPPILAWRLRRPPSVQNPGTPADPSGFSPTLPVDLRSGPGCVATLRPRAAAARPRLRHRDAALLSVILTAFVLFPLCVLASRAADAVRRSEK